jgi:hypothetical protein
MKTADMRRRLRDEPGLGRRFLAHLLAANSRFEADLVGQLFDLSEVQLARALLLLAKFDQHQQARHPLPIISRNVLADMIGASRSKVDRLMNGFRKLGFLERHRERDGGVQVHCSMLRVVLQD